MVNRYRIPAARIRALWLDPTIRTEDAAKQLGISRQLLSDMASRLGLPSRKGLGGKIRSKGTDAEFRRLWLAGVSLKDMQAYFGYASHRGVCTRRERLGLPLRTRGGCGKRWRETISITDYHDALLAEAMAGAASAGSRT